MEEGAAGLVVELQKEFHTEKFSELLSDNNSEAELGLISIEKQSNRKRKRGNITDVSCSSYSSGAGSPLNLPFTFGFIGKTGFESTDENSDGSKSKSFSGPPGYQSATTAVVSDSDDEIDFPNDVTDLDTFSVEYEPPETNSEDENDGDDSDEEKVIIIPSSSEDEDPGADGGDEYDIDSENEDSWECTECWTMNFPMTTKCLRCWKEKISFVQQLNRTTSAPTHNTFKDNACIPTLTRSVTSLPSVNSDVKSLSRSSSSCSSTAPTSCDSGISVSSCETDTERTKDNQIKSDMAPSCSTSICNSTSFHHSTIQTTTVRLPELQKETTVEGIEAAVILSSDAINRTSVSESHTEFQTLVEGPSNQNDDTTHLCVICSTEPRNASIIHGRSGHQVCCISCAEKLKAAKMRCPVCRRRIHFVIKNFL